MSDMRTAKTISITLPPDLLLKAQEFAQQEHRTMSELFREALRRYMSSAPPRQITAAKQQEWDAMLERTRAKAEELGIRTEEDVERLVHEHRRDKRP